MRGVPKSTFYSDTKFTTIHKFITVEIMFRDCLDQSVNFQISVIIVFVLKVFYRVSASRDAYVGFSSLTIMLKP